VHFEKDPMHKFLEKGVNEPPSVRFLVKILNEKASKVKKILPGFGGSSNTDIRKKEGAREKAREPIVSIVKANSVWYNCIYFEIRDLKDMML
jgi:hypothetical protein